MKAKFATADKATTPARARALGWKAGKAAAIRYRRDPQCFEESPNPFGVDSEPALWEAWQDAYENAFELLK
jgi:hypothetical protein